MTTSEPRNPLYFLLLLISLIFVVTALAYAVLPVLEQQALDAGEPPTPSPFRDALMQDGWRWLLYELLAMIVLGLASMVLDAWQGRDRETGQVTSSPPPSGPTAERGEEGEPYKST